MNKQIVPLYYGKKLVYTADGSISFYNMDYCEGLHAKSVGAFTESLHKFVIASNILNILSIKDVSLLDICFGVGYNLAVTLDKVSNVKNIHRLHITAIDKDASLINIIKKCYFLWPTKGFNMLRTLLERKSYGNISLELYIMDVLDFLKSSKGLFDIIYFDPFSLKNNSSLWQLDVYKKLYEIMYAGGVVVTYVSSKAIRRDFEKAGFVVKSFKKLRDSFMESSIFIKPCEARFGWSGGDFWRVVKHCETMFGWLGGD